MTIRRSLSNVHNKALHTSHRTKLSNTRKARNRVKYRTRTQSVKKGGNELIKRMKANEHFASVFSKIREHFSVEEDFQNEMRDDSKWSEPKKAGKSGSTLLYSPSKTFIIKSLLDREYTKLCKHILAYYQHVVTQPSLLTRLCGLYTFDGKHYLAMVNALPTASGDIYDLKGSWDNRISEKKTKIG